MLVFATSDNAIQPVRIEAARRHVAQQMDRRRHYKAASNSFSIIPSVDTMPVASSPPERKWRWQGVSRPDRVRDWRPTLPDLSRINRVQARQHDIHGAIVKVHFMVIRNKLSPCCCSRPVQSKGLLYLDATSDVEKVDLKRSMHVMLLPTTTSQSFVRRICKFKQASKQAGAYHLTAKHAMPIYEGDCYCGEPKYTIDINMRNKSRKIRLPPFYLSPSYLNESQVIYFVAFWRKMLLLLILILSQEEKRN